MTLGLFLFSNGALYCVRCLYFATLVVLSVRFSIINNNGIRSYFFKKGTGPLEVGGKTETKGKRVKLLGDGDCQ